MISVESMVNIAGGIILALLVLVAIPLALWLVWKVLRVTWKILIPSAALSVGIFVIVPPEEIGFAFGLCAFFVVVIGIAAIASDVRKPKDPWL